MRMPTVAKMGRKKLGRVPCNITLPEELSYRAYELSAHEGRALSHLVEAFLAPYVEKRWTEAMRSEEIRTPRPKRKGKQAKGAK